MGGHGGPKLGLWIPFVFLLHLYPNIYVLPSGLASLVSVAAFFRPCQSHEWEIGAIKWPWLCDNGVWQARTSESSPIVFSVNLERFEGHGGPKLGLSHPRFEGHGGPWRAQAWPLDSIRLLTSFYTPILSPATTPHPPTLLLPPVIL